MIKLSLRELVRRTLLAIVLPHRVFRAIRGNEAPSWISAAALLASVSVVGVNVMPYLIYGSWLCDILPNDWILQTIGWTIFSFVQWLLCMLIFAGVGRCVGSRAGTIAAFSVASYYLVLGNWLIALIVDSSYYFVSLPIIPIHIAFLDQHLSWMNTPFEPVLSWVRLSYFINFPWLSISVWFSLRYLLEIKGWRGVIGTGLFAVVLPILGRLVIEQLPLFCRRWLIHSGVETLSRGAMTLVTFSLVAGGLVRLLFILLQPWRGKRAVGHE